MADSPVPASPTASSPVAGLTSDEAAARLAVDGPNDFPEQGRRGAVDILVSQLRSPLVLVLVGAAILSRALGDRIESLVIIGIITLNSLLAFAQEYRAERSLRALRRFVTRTARVRRDGRAIEAPAETLVRGDVVLLEVGDLVPADLKLAECVDLEIDESSVTGESEPVSKSPGADAMMGSTVQGGTGSGVVQATGRGTMLGRMAGLLRAKPEETDFQRNIRRLSDMLVWVIVLLAIFVFMANALLAKGWFDSLLFALALAVGITPEALPTIMTIALSRGALRMAREQVVVKRLMSVEDLGNIDILCSDKTGTLTLGAFSLNDFVALDGTRDLAVLLDGALAGAAELGVPGAPAANPTDRALWGCADLTRLAPRLSGCRVLARQAFDFHRRRATVLVAEGDARRLVVKGAPESVLPRCTSLAAAAAVMSLDEIARQRVMATIDGYEHDGLRVLAVAHREVAPTLAAIEGEEQLILSGLLLYSDPPKPEAREALARLAELGVAVKLLSGDSAVVTRRICREVGLEVSEEQVVSGETLGKLEGAEFQAVALRATVFSRVSPEQKQQLVAALRAAGKVVGFVGDGVNDAPALRAADVGIAVDSGADVAKEAADVVLLQKSLAVIAHGIVEGRRTFANITKYIFNTISANFGNMATVAVSSLFLRFIPLLPSQILLNNFLSDLPLVTIATDRVDAGLIRRPRHWDIAGIARFMVLFGLLSASFDLLLIIPLLKVWHADAPLFRTAWFVESACSEMIVTFALRTQLPFFRSRPSALLLWSSVAGVLVAFLLPSLALGARWFEFVNLPWHVTMFIGTILVGYFAAAEIAKRGFFRRTEA